MGLLKGQALSWASAVWDSGSPISFSYHYFTTGMRKVFHHPVKGSNADNRLINLRQGPRSVADYSVEF